MPSVQVTVDLPQAEAFRLFSNLENAPLFSRPAVKRTRKTAGPVAAGTVFRAIDKWPGRKVRYNIEITDCEPDRRLAARFSVPMDGVWSASFAPCERGTLVTYEGSLTPGGLAGLFTPLLHPSMKREMQRYLDSFKAWAEAEVTATVATETVAAQPA